MEPEFVNESMWDDDEEGANNDDTNFGEDDSNMEMTGFDGSATGDGNITGGGEGGAVGDAQDPEPLFLTNDKSKEILIMEGFKFRQNGPNVGGKARWRCYSHARFSCKAVVHTWNREIVYYSKNHTTGNS